MLYSSIAALALAGSTLAAPHAPQVGAAKKSSAAAHGVPGYYKQVAPVGVADGEYFKYPLSNNFPDQDSDATEKIQAAAGGALPNGALPTSLNPDSIINFRLIAFNELSEVAFFTSLLQKINKNVRGYRPSELSSEGLATIKQSIEAIQAQEEEHALAANAALAALDANGLGPIKPCEYDFPDTDLKTALAFASQFTSLVLGTLQDVINHFAKNGDLGPIQRVASVIGQEGEQNGWFRSLIGYRPTPQPFKTTSSRDLAFSTLQQFVKPGSCPQNITDFGMKIYPGLDIPVQPMGNSAKVSFRILDYNKTTTQDVESYQVVYINGQNKPITQKIVNSRRSKNDNVKFEAAWPSTKTAPMYGMTVALITPVEEYATAAQAINATVFGPGLIFVN